MLARWLLKWGRVVLVLVIVPCSMVLTQNADAEVARANYLGELPGEVSLNLSDYLGAGGVAAAEEGAVEAGAAAGPPGWALLALWAAGTALYATRSWWMPKLKGAFGSLAQKGMDYVNKSGGVYGCDPTASTDAAGRTHFYGTSCSLGQMGILNPTYPEEFEARVNNGVGSAQYLSFATMGRCLMEDGSVSYHPLGYSNNLVLPGNSYGEIAFDCGRKNKPLDVYGLSACDPQGGCSNMLIPENINFHWVNPDVQVPNQTKPTQQETATIHCVKEDGSGATFDVSVTTAWADNEDQIQMPACPAGSHGTGYSVTGTDYPGAPEQVLYTVAPKDSGQYPKCAITSAARCLLEVWVDGKKCSIGDALCVNWTQTYVAEPSRVECRWDDQAGTLYSLPVKDCFVLERGYDGQDDYLTKSNTDGDPNTSTDGDNDGTGKPRTAPTTRPTTTGGNLPSGTASNTPGSSPSGSAVPSNSPGYPTGGDNPNPSPKPDPDTNSNNCTGVHWSMNPVDFVLIPVKCALVWAFKPDPDTFTDEVGETKDLLETKPPFSLVKPIFDMIGGIIGGASGCGGKIADFGAGLVVPCSPGDYGWAHTFYAGCSLALIVAAGFYLWRMVEQAMHKQ